MPESLRTKMGKVVQEALSGSCKVKITYKSEATIEVGYLLALIRRGYVYVDYNTEAYLERVGGKNGQWNFNHGNKGERTFVVHFSPYKFNTITFIDKLHDVLEDIEVVDSD